MRALALGAALCILGVGSAPALAEAPSAPLDDLKAQGKLYLKRGLPKQALSTMDRAWATPAGKQDAETALLRARAAYELLLLEVAFEMVDTSLGLAEGDADVLEDAQALKGEMSGLFGALHVEASEGETNEKGRIFFESKTGMVNKEKKAHFESIRTRFRETDIELPRTVFLPYGHYTANNVPFEIVQGAPSPTVKIILQIRRDEDDDDSALWWYLGGGAVAAAAVAVGVAFLVAEPDPEVREAVRLQW